MITPDEAAERLGAAESAGHISQATLRNIRRWLTETPFARYRPRLLEDIARGRWAELDDAFFTVLEFGTGGRRGKMYPVGTNVLNERTIAESARGLADYVTSKKGADARRTCVIARDTRHHSAKFAELCARCSRPPASRSSCSEITVPPPCSLLPSAISTAMPAS